MLTLYAELCHLTGKDRYKKAYREIYRRKQEEPGRKKKTREAMQEESQGIKKQARKQKERMAEPVDAEQRHHVYKKNALLSETEGISPQRFGKKRGGCRDYPAHGRKRI